MTSPRPILNSSGRERSRELSNFLPLTRSVPTSAHAATTHAMGTETMHTPASKLEQSCMLTDAGKRSEWHKFQLPAFPSKRWSLWLTVHGQLVALLRESLAIARLQRLQAHSFLLSDRGHSTTV
jgi:hypothetical protein